MSDPADAVIEMLVRTVPDAPPYLLADAAGKFRRIVENERRQARRDAIAELTCAGFKEAAAKLEGC